MILIILISVMSLFCTTKTNTRFCLPAFEDADDLLPIMDFFPETSGKTSSNPDDPNMFPFHLNELREDSRRGRELRQKMMVALRRRAKALKARKSSAAAKRRRTQRHSEPELKPLVNNRVQHSPNSFSYQQIRMS